MHSLAVLIGCVHRAVVSVNRKGSPDCSVTACYGKAVKPLNKHAFSPSISVLTPGTPAKEVLGLTGRDPSWHDL